MAEELLQRQIDGLVHELYGQVWEDIPLSEKR